MPSTSALSGIPELSLSAAANSDYRLVGEGAANAVFEVVVPPSDRICREIFQGRLLRVPKAGTSAHSCFEIQEYWETAVRPLFEPEDLVQHQLIKLGQDAVTSQLNSALARADHFRRADFRGSRVAATEYGMLVEDMRPKHPDDLVLEFKPKWLAQSPGAPTSATRCRTCAREALKLHTKPHKTDPNLQILCPLDLLACGSSPRALSNTLTHLTSLPPPLYTQQTTRPTDQHRRRLAHWLQTNTLLPRLRAAQVANAGTGVLGAGENGDGDGDSDSDSDGARLQLAMTLRDCTCFVRIPADPRAPVEAKLADLDKKNAAAKLGYWRATERRLIEGGYYEGREVPRERTDCQFERGMWSFLEGEARSAGSLE